MAFRQNVSFGRCAVYVNTFLFTSTWFYDQNDSFNDKCKFRTKLTNEVTVISTKNHDFSVHM